MSEPSNLPATTKSSAVSLVQAIAKAEVSLRPADPKVLQVAVGRLALHKQVKDMPEQQWAMVMEDYLDDLSRYPGDLVLDALVHLRRYGSPFFPTVGEIIAVIEYDTGERLRSWRMLKEEAEDQREREEWERKRKPIGLEPA